MMEKRNCATLMANKCKFINIFKFKDVLQGIKNWFSFKFIQKY